MKHIYNNDKLEIQRLKHSKRTTIVGFILFILMSSIVIGMMFLKTIEDKKRNERANKIISNLENENRKLRTEITSKQNQISYLTRKNIELERNRYTQRQKYTTPKTIKSKTQEKKYTQSKPKITTPKIYNQENKYTAPKYTPPKYQTPKKIYPRYDNAKLISDSKITRMADNRLHSTMPIYGRYIDKYGITTDCGNNENIYKIINECTGIVFPLEKIYFKKSNKSNIVSHNRKTHMIECKYDYENGLMHDCSVKLKGI